MTFEGMMEQAQERLLPHVGHKIVIAEYGDGDNLAVECQRCSEVLIDFTPDDQLAHRGRDGFCAKCGGDCEYTSEGVKK